jgi:asparagine synthetase B (glutamine-hydrolysing)
MHVTSKLVVPNLVRGDDPAEAIASIPGGAVDRPVLGRFAVARRGSGFVDLIRDRLGLNKLFFHLDRERDELTVGSFILGVSRTTKDYGRICSVPPGHCLRFHEETLEVESIPYYDIHACVESMPALDPDAFRARVDSTLASSVAELSGRSPDARFFVCLSGGLDSTVIAGYAKRLLPGAAAVTFSYVTPQRNEPGVWSGDALERLDRSDPLLSDDFHAARSIAEALDLPFVAVLERKSLDREKLRRVLVSGQDWRDFNVHCAWVNDSIAEGLRREYRRDPIVVITGDLMNEFVADYTPVVHGGKEYYPQPRVSRKRLRAFFVYGLEAGDREVGIFKRHGIVAVQPYADLAELYLALPADAIEPADAKEKLNLPLIPNARVRSLVSRVKVRAQVGGKEGGTLALFHDHGIDQESLLGQWLAIFKPFAREGAIRDDLITTGRYRMMENQ